MRSIYSDVFKRNAILLAEKKQKLTKNIYYKTKPKDYVNTECAICLQMHNWEDSITTFCGHVFGTECYEKWYDKHKTCPICRTKKSNSIVHRKFLKAMKTGSRNNQNGI
jgi:hypothetical protein